MSKLESLVTKVKIFDGKVNDTLRGSYTGYFLSNATAFCSAANIYLGDYPLAGIFFALTVYSLHLTLSNPGKKTKQKVEQNKYKK